jgi:hypothetical protein
MILSITVNGNFLLTEQMDEPLSHCERLHRSRAFGDQHHDRFQHCCGVAIRVTSGEESGDNAHARPYTDSAVTSGQ